VKEIHSCHDPGVLVSTYFKGQFVKWRNLEEWYEQQGNFATPADRHKIIRFMIDEGSAEWSLVEHHAGDEKALKAAYEDLKKKYPDTH
jgi:hypothetical protein